MLQKGSKASQSANSKKPDLDQKPDIILNSPVGGKPAIFKYSNTSLDDIVETMRWVSREYQEFKPAIDNLLTNHEEATYEDVKSFCDRYNKITGYVNKMNKGTSIALKTSSRASHGLLKHLMHQIYSQSITDPEKLNQYAPFSSEVYGETSFEFVAQMIEDNQSRPQEVDTFIDLGSGVGQVVLQVAASVNCKKCYGIEKADVPAKFSKLMEEKFRFWMDWFGKTYTEFEIFHGDFFDEKFVDIIKESTHLFINNFAFEPEVDHKLKQKFIDLKDGTRIISSKQFCPLKNRLTERDLNDIGSIMHVIEIQPEQKKDSVSWTDKVIPYYLHTLDGTRVERYYEKQKQRIERSESLPRRKRSSSSNSTSTEIKSNKRRGVKIRSSKLQKKISTHQTLNKTPIAAKESTNLRPSKRKRTQSIMTNDSLSSNQTQIATPIDGYQSPIIVKGENRKKRVRKFINKSSANLEFLHEKTIESASIDFSEPSQGCINHRIDVSSKTYPSSIPNIIINDISMYLGTRDIDKVFDSLKNQFSAFISKIRRPGTRESLLREIQKEKEKKQELLYAEENLKKHINQLSTRANKAAGLHCESLGIKNSSNGIIDHLKMLLDKHQELSKQIYYLSTYPIPTKKPQPIINSQNNPPVAHSQNSNKQTWSSIPQRHATSAQHIPNQPSSTLFFNQTIKTGQSISSCNHRFDNSVSYHPHQSNPNSSQIQSALLDLSTKAK